MDIVHHTLIGGAGLSIAVNLEEPLLGAAFIFGSVFPDLDVIFILLGKRFYLRNHQGVTHSIILAPIFTLLLCLPLLWLLNLSWNWPIYIAMLSGILLHITLDWFNTFRIALFYPLKKERYSLDAVFFIDSVLLVFTASFYLGYIYFEIKSAAWLYPSLFSLYCAAKLYLQKKIINQLKPLYAIPSSLNPFEFYILERNGNDLTGYLYNGLTSKKNKIQVYNTISDTYQQLANKSNVYREIKSITRELTITDAIETDEEIIITAHDLAVRNFGGKFAKTTLTFDKQGNLRSEMANI